MKPTIVLACATMLTFTLASCNKQKTATGTTQTTTKPIVQWKSVIEKTNATAEIEQQARRLYSAETNKTYDLLNEESFSFYDISFYDIFPDEYFGDERNWEPVCTPKKEQYLNYRGKNQTASNYADYYNAIMVHNNLISDMETALRFVEYDSDVYRIIADSVMLLDCSIIRDATLRRLVKNARNAIADELRERAKIIETKLELDSVGFAVDSIESEPGSSERKVAFRAMFGFIAERVNPVISGTDSAYNDCMDRKAYFAHFDSVLMLRGMSDKEYQQELLNHIYLAESPAERHVYTIEFAHSDSANASFMKGAAALNREFVEYKGYSPYLVEMWRTWRASMTCLIGASTWAYIPNVAYNVTRRQVAEIILKQIESNPSDLLAQGLLISLGDASNISRFGSVVGNGSMVERMMMFPETIDE